MKSHYNLGFFSNEFYLISQQCKRTRSRPGDGIDNDCDGRIDEELLDGKDTDGDGRIGEDLAVVIEKARVYSVFKTNFIRND